jgi:hypothetical protein
MCLDDNPDALGVPHLWRANRSEGHVLRRILAGTSSPTALRRRLMVIDSEEVSSPRAGQWRVRHRAFVLAAAVVLGASARRRGLLFGCGYFASSGKSLVRWHL